MKAISAAALLAATLIAAGTAHAAPKIQIAKHGINFTKIGNGYRAEPYATIKNNIRTSQYNTRPLITTTILIKKRDAGTLKCETIIFNWETSKWEPDRNKINPLDASQLQPTCDYKRISNKTIRNQGKSVGYGELSFNGKPKILAQKTRIYIAGKLAAELETTESACTWTDWEKI
jgi:hypothetical protein